MAELFQGKLAIFPVKEKQNENGPDHTGTIEIPHSEVAALRDYLMQAETEKDYQGNAVIKLSVSTWINEMKDGRKYLKGSVRKPYKPDAAPAPAAPSEDEMPF